MKSYKALAKKEGDKKRKNPGKAGKERRKDGRGDTWAGIRPSIVLSKKEKNKKRGKLKRDARKEITNYL